MVGGGGFGWAPGEWTDDTSMAIAIAEVAATGADLRDDAAQNASSGAGTAGHGPRRTSASRPATCSALGAQGVSAANARDASRRLHERTGHTAGNGSLMRTAPVALAYLDDEAALVVGSTCRQRVDALRSRRRGRMRAVVLRDPARRADRRAGRPHRAAPPRPRAPRPVVGPHRRRRVGPAVRDPEERLGGGGAAGGMVGDHHHRHRRRAARRPSGPGTGRRGAGGQRHRHRRRDRGRPARGGVRRLGGAGTLATPPARLARARGA